MVDILNVNGGDNVSDPAGIGNSPAGIGNSPAGIGNSSAGMGTSPSGIGNGRPAETNPDSRMTSRVVRGSLWSLSGQAVVLLASMVATPFIIRYLGPEQYGVLSLINIVIGYLTFAEFGMGVASTRFGAEAYARQDNDGEAAVVWTSIWIAAIPTLVVCLLFILGARILVEDALRLPLSVHGVAIKGLRLASVGFFARTMAGILNTPQVIRLRMDLVTKINTTGYIVQTILTLVAVLLGAGLLGAVATVSAVNVLIAVALGVFSLRLQPRLVQPQLDRELMKPLLRFGGAVVVTSLAGIVLVNAEKVLLARFASITSLAYYSVAFSLAMMLSQVPSAMNQSLLPALSNLQTNPNRAYLNQLCRRALHGTIFWVVPAGLLMAIVARPFLSLWAGPQYGENSTIPFYILVAGLIVNLLAWVPYNLLIALGKTGLIAKFHLIEIIPYLVVAALLTRSFGAVGAALTWTLRVLVSSPIIFFFARRASGMSLSPVPNNPLAFTLSVVVLVVPSVITRWLSSSPAVLIPVAVTSALVYVTLIWTTILTDDERRGVRLMVPLKVFHPRIEDRKISS